MKVEIKKLAGKDINQFLALIRVFEEVFEMKNFVMPDEGYLQTLVEKEDFLVFVAVSEDKVVGGLTAYTLQQYYSKQPLVYIYDLAIKTECQRQGIGTLLISNIINYCQKTGVEEIFVQADLEDDHAVKFYRSTGGTAEEVVHFNYPLNVEKP